jgi:predicted SAM-dependent methyltransferase
MKKKIKYILSFSPYSLYEIFRNKKKHNIRIKNQKLIINDYLKNNEVKKIQIGCGSNFLEGWLNTDLKDSDTIAFLDAGEKFPIESDTFDFVYSEHLFEHLTVEQQHNMLVESYRILKKGGVMRVATPSLDFLFSLYANPMTLENRQYVNWAVDNIPNLGIISNSIIDIEEHYCYVINNFFKAWGHQMIHNYSSLKKMAMQNRFSDFRLSSVNKSEVLYLQNIENHGTIIPENMNIIETMVVEIIK